MRILSIDQSLTNCACILWDNGVIEDYFVLHSDKTEENHVRIYKIAEKISNYIESESVELLVLEGLSFGSISTSVRPLAGLYYAILMGVYCNEIEWQEVAPSSVKKFACHGRAKKKEMWDALPEKIKTKFESTHKTIKSGKQDLADAYWIGQYCITNLERG